VYAGLHCPSQHDEDTQGHHAAHSGRHSASSSINQPLGSNVKLTQELL
jgi:hypothetical protein